MSPAANVDVIQPPATRAEAPVLWAALRLAFVLGVLLLDLWPATKLHPAWRVLLYASVAVVVLRSPQSPGGEDRLPGKMWPRALALTAALCLVLAAAGEWLREPYEVPWRFLQRKSAATLLWWFAVKAAVAAAQQFLLHRFVTPSCRAVVGDRPAAQGLSATLFALIHLPNAALAAMCLVAGWLWIRLFEQSGRLLPFILSHVTLAVMVHGLLPERLHLDLRVGGDALVRIRHLRELEGEETRRLIADFSSAEYFARQGGTERGFLQGLYRDLLGRSPAEWERKRWLERLSRYNHAEIVEAFAVAPERFRLKGVTASRSCPEASASRRAGRR